MKTNTKNDPSRLLSIGEVSSHLRFSTETIRRWCRKGLLPAKKISREWRIHPVGLRKLIKSNDIQFSNKGEVQQ